MQNLTISRYMALLEPLSIEKKLELINQLSESVKRNFKKEKKEKDTDEKTLVNELFGTWDDVSDSATEDIYAARTISTKEINFD